jgi:hypothetical protein
MAYGLCISLGVYHHQKVQPIKVKKHGYKANSFFRSGLNRMRTLLKMKKPDWQEYINKFIRWIITQLAYYQSFILAG